MLTSASDPKGSFDGWDEVGGVMQFLALRGRIDRFWFIAGLAFAVWCGVCLSSGETYLPGRYGRPSAWLSLVSDPAAYWRTMKLWGGLSVWFFMLSVFRSPLVSEWRERAELRMQRERARPIKRSLLWKLFFYAFVPLGLILGLFFLAIGGSG